MKKLSQFIAEFRGNSFDELVSEKMQELVNAVALFQKAGKLTLEIHLTPKNDGAIITICKFAVKKPERDTVESIMFSTPEGDLLANDPTQPSMFDRIQTIDGGKTISKSM